VGEAETEVDSGKASALAFRRT